MDENKIDSKGTDEAYVATNNALKEIAKDFGFIRENSQLSKTRTDELIKTALERFNVASEERNKFIAAASEIKVLPITTGVLDSLLALQESPSAPVKFLKDIYEDGETLDMEKAKNEEHIRVAREFEYERDMLMAKLVHTQAERDELLKAAEINASENKSNNQSSVKMTGNTIVDDMISARKGVIAIRPADWVDVNTSLSQISQKSVSGMDRIKMLNSIIDQIADRTLTTENSNERARDCKDIEKYLGDFIKEFEPVRASYSVIKEDQKVMRRVHKKWDNRANKAELAVSSAQREGLTHKAAEFEKLYTMAEATRDQMKSNVSKLDEQLVEVANLIHESNMAKTKLLSIIVSCNRFVRNYGTVGSSDNAVKALSQAFRNITNYEISLNPVKAIEQ